MRTLRTDLDLALRRPGSRAVNRPRRRLRRRRRASSRSSWKACKCLRTERAPTRRPARSFARPGGTAVVDQKAIEQTRGANLRDVLDFVPGVMIRPRFGRPTRASSRFGAPACAITFTCAASTCSIDGFIYGQADGFSDFEALELLTTKRIEVYKGANALQYGGYTLGGAINLVSKTGYDAEGSSSSAAKPARSASSRTTSGQGQVYGPFDLYAAFADTELDGYRDHSEQVRRRAFATFGYLFPGGTTIRLDLGYTHSEERAARSP